MHEKRRREDGISAVAHPADPAGERPVVSTRAFKRNQVLLACAQLFGGVGIAVGIAVGGLLAEDLTGTTEFAGFSQTASILGAGLLAIPLAKLAGVFSRRVALTVGFSVALCGALTVVSATLISNPVVFFLGMLMFGSATASGLQARYAATDDAPPHLTGRAMSFVVWATTIGSVAGPNLSEPGAELGIALGFHPLVGPFLISIAVFIVAAGFTSLLRAPHPPAGDSSLGEDAEAGTGAARSGLFAGLKAAAGNRVAMMGLSSVVCGHMMMVSVMVMTPVHMHHHGLELHLVGIVISLHILGMYGLSPVYGWLTDRMGAVPVIVIGQFVFLTSIIIGIFDAIQGSDMIRISIALTLLGLGWSATLIGGSTLLSESVDREHRVAIQGTTDALMNFGAAGLAALAGPLLAAGGFVWINVGAGIVLLVLVMMCFRARYGRAQPGTFDASAA